MALFRYVGSAGCEIGNRVFSHVGQRAEFDEPTFREVIAGGAAFISEEAFEKVGITDDEIALLQRNPVFGQRGPLSEKIEQAQDIFRDARSLVQAELPL